MICSRWLYDRFDKQAPGKTVTSQLCLVKKVKTITGNSDYRVKDVVDKNGRRWKHSADKVIHSNKYQGTILQSYLRLLKSYQELSVELDETKNSRSLLLRLIKERIIRIRMKCPKHNELVVHLRMGDVVSNADGSTRIGQEYIVVSNIVKYLKKYPEISRITIVTCFAFQDWSESSKKEYTANNPDGVIPDWGWSQEKEDLNIKRFNQIEKSIRQYFPEIDLDVMSSINIDDDLCYGAMSNHFIPSFGGFTQLLQELSIMNKSKSFSSLDFLPAEILLPLVSSPLELEKEDSHKCIRYRAKRTEPSNVVISRENNSSPSQVKKGYSNKLKISQIGPMVRTLKA